MSSCGRKREIDKGSIVVKQGGLLDQQSWVPWASSTISGISNACATFAKAGMSAHAPKYVGLTTTRHPIR